MPANSDANLGTVNVLPGLPVRSTTLGLGFVVIGTQTHAHMAQSSLAWPGTAVSLGVWVGGTRKWVFGEARNPSPHGGAWGGGGPRVGLWLGKGLARGGGKG